MSSSDGEEFAKSFLAHAYDPVKAHEYYLRTRKLKGRTPGEGRPSATTPPQERSRRSRATAIGNRAAAQVGTRRSAAIQRLTDKAKDDLATLTEEFRSWVDSHPRVSDSVRQAKRKEMLDRKDDIIRTLKSDVAKITSAASSKSKTTAATEGRQH
jgi:hypothetical protein